MEPSRFRLIFTDSAGEKLESRERICGPASQILQNMNEYLLTVVVMESSLKVQESLTGRDDNNKTVINIDHDFTVSTTTR